MNQTIETWTDLANALRTGDDPIQASASEIVNALQVLHASPEAAEEAWTADHWAFCQMLEIELGLDSDVDVVSDAQIEALSTEAGEAGDLEQVALCQAALEGDAAARAKCERAIRNAQAQGE